MRRARVCWMLMREMLLISSMTFGGGFVIVSLMKKRFVDELHLLEEDEMLDLAAIAQSAPGAIAVNAAILVGNRAAGAAGVISAVAGTVLPPLVILGVISVMYRAFAESGWVRAILCGMRAGAAAVVADVAFSLAIKNVRSREPVHIALMAAAFAAVLLGASAMAVLAGAVLLGVVLALLEGRRRA